MAYLDTSVLGSYYCPESLSHAVNAALMGISDAVITPLVEVEFCSLLAMKIRKKGFDRSTAEAVLSQFRLHLADGIYRVVDVGVREYHLARDCLTQFNTPLRALDSIHLAAASAYRQELFTTDKPLADAAKILGIPYRLIR